MYLIPGIWYLKWLILGISSLRGSKTGALGRRMVEMSVASPPPRLRSHDRRIGQHTDGIAHNSDGIAHSTDGIAHNSAAFSSHFGQARIFIHTALCRWNCNDENLFGKHCKCSTVTPCNTCYIFSSPATALLIDLHCSSSCVILQMNCFILLTFPIIKIEFCIFV